MKKVSSISRRGWLRAIAAGAGGLALTPLLSRIAGAGPEPVRRFVFIVEGNCFEPVTMLGSAARAALDASLGSPLGDDRWWYSRYRHTTPIEVATGLETAPALSPLAAGTSLVPNAAVLLGLSSKVIGGGHSAAHGVLGSARSIAGIPGGPTIDAVLGAMPAVRGETPYDVLRLGVSNDASRPLDFGTCAYAEARPAPMILQPTAAFDSLFGSVASTEGRVAFARRGGLLDFAAGDVRAARDAFVGGSAERAKLEAYLSSIEELTLRQERMLALEAELTAARPALPDENPLYGTDDPLDRFRAQMELATAALLGELTHVCVVGCGSGGNFDMSYPTVISGVNRHDLHHGSSRMPTFLSAIHEVTRLQVEAIATMARRLASTPEVGGGTMLDHTVIVYVGDNGEQHHATASDFPMLLIGGNAMGLRTGGRTVVVPGMDEASHRQVSNVWNALGHLAGADLNEFGAEGPTRIAPGPLEGLLT